MPLQRRTTLALLAATAFCAAAPALAQSDFPGKPVNIFTPFPPGSGPDALLRAITDKLGALWKQPVLVQNRPGAGGFVVFEATRRLPADGYTLVQLDSVRASIDAARDSIEMQLLQIERARAPLH